VDLRPLPLVEAVVEADAGLRVEAEDKVRLPR
jgi:hypothetical protein